MKEQCREDPKILAAAERQMHQWSLAQQFAEEAVRAYRFDDPHRRKVGSYIAVSREAGSGGSQIAALIGEKLGWDVLDKNVVDRVAERFQLPKEMLELVDETHANWVYDTLGAWMDPKVISHEKYVVRLCRVVWAAARRGNVVFVGRGAHFLLPRDRGMAVRIIASEKYRLRHLMEQHGCNESQARHFMTELERDRQEFVKRYFHRDILDPHLFDLVVQVDRLGTEGAADLIVDAYHRFYAADRRPQPATAAR